MLDPRKLRIGLIASSTQTVEKDVSMPRWVSVSRANAAAWAHAARPCGTPVAAFARGPLPEILDARTGALSPADDVDDPARGIEVARGLWRAECRRRAARHFSLGAMTDRYLETYRSPAGEPPA